ncbi:MAG: cytochrome C [Boseongicola sp. SB0676_bin_33]|uniref:Cytochrome C n=1 Tax=Boseongicola sp. SB0664_bin_43 TaxID=2604844 RepID=A0A6B0Y4E5_9RHOB|nr:cytochrome C [Boseongicola sp. SB0664_bin_43]MYF89303.1 cytochrome C [Boseongicola sp. SB0676_bin_33]MYK30187.1 cytochrome C [Boseongicola sp. SB0670_bin_30]
MTRTGLTRRQALGFAGAALTAPILATPARAKADARVVVIGGGFGGTAAARAMRRIMPEVAVTLVTDAPDFATCPFSNLVIGGLRDMSEIRFSYDALHNDGVEVRVDPAAALDPAGRNVTLQSGDRLPYDRAIVSPGIDFRYDALPGVGPEVADRLPHAWKAGAQTILLRDQIRSMPQGGTVIIAPPDNPFRCPPGPYERASLIASYLSRHNPAAKIVIIDGKDKFSKQGLFMEGWQALYPGMIDFVPFSDHGGLKAIDADARRIETYFGDFKGDVINLIPPQQAAAIVLDAGLGGSGLWCEIDGLTFEAREAAHVHVIGDAAIVGDMPKSGFAAATQGKACAHAVAALLEGRDPPRGILMNTCYSLVGPEYGISVAGVYRSAPDTNRLASLPGSGGTSAAGDLPELRRDEADYARGWYANLTQELFGA